MIRLALTGSIGMGKTTAARLFAEEGVPIYDSDAAVHALYAKGGEAVTAVEAAFPGVSVDGAIDRTRLGPRVAHDPEAMARLEAIVHPLVAAGRAKFFETARATGAPVVVLDIPLLFETGRDAEADAIAVVSTTPQIQRARVLARPGMTQAKFEAILGRQMPDAEKRARADFLIDGNAPVEEERAQVRSILKAVTAPGWARRGRSAATLRTLDGGGERSQ
ncbi:MAG: dephospho-CoA kinase [Caulobacterales bacterium 32-69-10]|nr:MAG: dephospho-CoA kinase [Caulobacterales bacterium 32-69-10]